MKPIKTNYNTEIRTKTSFSIFFAFLEDFDKLADAGVVYRRYSEMEADGRAVYHRHHVIYTDAAEVPRQHFAIYNIYWLPK